MALPRRIPQSCRRGVSDEFRNRLAAIEHRAGSTNDPAGFAETELVRLALAALLGKGLSLLWMKRAGKIRVRDLLPWGSLAVNLAATVPPDSTPRVQHRWDRIIFNYGSYTIEVVFLPDGTVDVVYNSGFLRPIE